MSVTQLVVSTNCFSYPLVYFCQIITKSVKCKTIWLSLWEKWVLCRGVTSVRARRCIMQFSDSLLTSVFKLFLVLKTTGGPHEELQPQPNGNLHTYDPSGKVWCDRKSTRVYHISHKIKFAWRANQWPLVRKTLFSSFKGPQLARSLLPELQRNKDIVRCAALGAEIPGHR